MKFDKFTMKAQEALATTQQVAMAMSYTVLSAAFIPSDPPALYAFSFVNPNLFHNIYCIVIIGA